MVNCYCCSSLRYVDCCKSFVEGESFPETPLQLMRSRYSAYVIKNAAYLFNTTYIRSRKHTSIKDIMTWANENQFVRLEIINFSAETVEFKAYFFDILGKPQIHHEKSSFKKVNNKWFYVNGKFMI